MSNVLREARVRAWTVWAVGTCLAACLVMFGFREEFVQEWMIELGLIFAACVVSMCVIAGRTRDVGALLAAGWCGTLGVWCGRWNELCTRAAHEFLPRLGVASPSAVEAMELPATIACAGAVTAGLLLLATRSAGVAWACIGVSLAAAAVPLATDGSASVLTWAALGWQCATSAAMAVWAVDEAVRRSGQRCRSCGTDVRGLTSPVCPSCSAPLHAHAGRGALALGSLSTRRPV